MSTGALILAMIAVVLVVVLFLLRLIDDDEEEEFRRALGYRTAQDGAADVQERDVAIARAITEARLPPARQLFELDPDERIRLQERWREGQSCPHCGWMHNGVCPRVAKVTTERRGTQIIVTTEYWPNSQWEPPADAMSGRDLWEGAAPPAQQQGEQDGTSTAAAGPADGK